MAEISLVERTKEKESPVSSAVIKAAAKFWPWSERRLAVCVCCLAAADYASTVAFLKLGVDKGAYEAGVLAGPALKKGGLSGLFLNDVIVISILLLAAILIRNAFVKNKESRRFSHAAYVSMLLPYTFTAAAAVLNNLFIALY